MSLKNKIIYSQFFNIFVHPFFILFGLVYFLIYKKTPWISYWSMRKIYVSYGSIVPNTITVFFQLLKFRKDHKLAKVKSIFAYSEDQLLAINKEINLKGYCILPHTLPNKFILELEAIAKNQTVFIVDSKTKIENISEFKTEIGARYDLLESELIKSPVILQVSNDSYFLEIAMNYLGCLPLNDLIAMWWNIPSDSINKSQIAQMYHFDLDRPQFLKFFIYLSDVTLSTGPHSYIKGTHTKKKIQHDGRFSDQYVFDTFGKENEIIFCGKKGLILAEDTRGLHKGHELLEGYRLMFQIEFCSSFFGSEYNRIIIDNKEILTHLEKNRAVWQRFFN